MCRAPGQPGKPASQAQPAKIGNGFVAADGRQIAVVSLTERGGRRFAGEARSDDAGDIGALLLCDRRHAG